MMIAGHTLMDAFICAMLHLYFSLGLLELPLVLGSLIWTTFSKGRSGPGAMIIVFLLSFLASWCLHVYADSHGPGF